MILLYLAAIVAANLTTATFGPGASLLVAFVFIGLDLVARDRLHDRWRHEGLAWKMGLLIGSGSALPFFVNAGAGRIGLASFLAFGSASIVDAVVYSALRRRGYLVRVNGSNLPAAAVDSIVFPLLAFGSFLPWIMAGQFLAKVAGGFIWSLCLRRSDAAAHHSRRNVSTMFVFKVRTKAAP